MGKVRSPNYPAISLPEAIAKVRQIYNAEHRNRLSRKAIASVLGYEGLTGASQPLISALSKFGLLDGRGDAIRVSDDAVAILVDRHGSPERAEAVKRTASSPTIFQELDKRFDDVPSEDTARIFLEKRGFTSEAAQRVATNYRDTREFVIAEVGGYSTSTSKPPQIGDMVQWESQGVHQFQEPRRVVGLSEDGQWVFVEGSMSGLPLTEVSVEKAAEELEDMQPEPIRLAAPPNPFAGLPASGASERSTAARRAVLPLDEGEAILEWPASITATGAQDLEAWLQLLVRKIKRSAGLVADSGGIS